MKKIGILTFCNANNYGAVLQAFALKEHLNSLTYDVEFINLKFNQKTLGTSKPESQSVKNKIIDKIKRLKFKRFKKKYLPISEDIINGDKNKETLKSKYDFYIVGSDQVWNTDITNKTKAFFLDFLEDEKKISYAASYGKKDINEVEKKWSLEELPKFDAISVREEPAKVYLEKELNINANLVCDPVFLLKKDEWENVFNLKTKSKNKYIFVYYMEATEELRKTVDFLQNNMKLPVIAICGGGKNKLANCKNIEAQGPVDFLKKIRNAEIVVTNSFHAIAFSIIFEKKIMVISHSKWNVRLENLLNIIESEDKMIKNEDDIKIKNIIDGNREYRKLSNMIKQSKEFLKKALK